MLLSIVVQITSFIIATVALFLNINAGVGLSSSQRIQLSVDINLLNAVPSTYAIYMDNVTVNTDGIRTLTQCTEYVETHVPVVPPFDATIVINTTYAEEQLANLTVVAEGRGTITVLQVGNVTVEETNAVLSYSKEYITFGDSALHYIAIEPGTVMYVAAGKNGTVALTFSEWSPAIGSYGSTGYNAIYDINQLDIQSALPVIRVQKKQFLENGAIVVGESTVAINEGDVVSVTKRLQL
jgi:hypothetical protein